MSVRQSNQGLLFEKIGEEVARCNAEQSEHLIDAAMVDEAETVKLGEFWPELSVFHLGDQRAGDTVGLISLLFGNLSAKSRDFAGGQTQSLSHRFETLTSFEA